MNSSVVRVTEASYCDHDGEEGGDDEVEKDVNDKSDLENDDGDDQYSSLLAESYCFPFKLEQCARVQSRQLIEYKSRKMVEEPMP